MPGKIRILPDHVSQVIAAGEVVERPASVVKELMENAIDAGGSEIIVELKAGGLQLIRVIDNGEGMDQEDVPVAFQRYATSKIRKAEDLYAIHTLGFRGEALPSISQVSHVTLQTRTLHSLSGTRAICEGGEIKKISEIGCPIGTEVEVKNIFYNIPVKRKFLKSIRSELRYALHHFLRLSLSHPPFRLNSFTMADPSMITPRQNPPWFESKLFLEKKFTPISVPSNSKMGRSRSQGLRAFPLFQREMLKEFIFMSINDL